MRPDSDYARGYEEGWRQRATGAHVGAWPDGATPRFKDGWQAGWVAACYGYDHRSVRSIDAWLRRPLDD